MTNPSVRRSEETFGQRARALVLLATVLVLAAPSLLAADRLVAGQYEVTSITNGKTATTSYCASPEIANGTNGDAKAVEAYLVASVKTCSIKDFSLVGDTISYSMTCAGRTTTIHANYHGDRFEGDRTTSVNGQTFVTQTTAKRSGACKPE